MSRRTIAAAFAAGALCASAATAQTALTPDEVRRFFERSMQEAATAATAGDWKGASAWVNGHLTEDATFAIKGTVLGSGGPVLTFATTLGRDDVDRFTRLFAAKASGGAIKDYTLGTEVAAVDVLADGSAAARVQFRETAAVDLAALLGGGAPAGPPSVAVIQATSTCDLRLAKGADGEVEIALASCDTTVTL